MKNEAIGGRERAGSIFAIVPTCQRNYCLQEKIDSEDITKTEVKRIKDRTPNRRSVSTVPAASIVTNPHDLVIASCGFAARPETFIKGTLSFRSNLVGSQAGYLVISITLTDEKYDKNGKVRRSRASQLRDASRRDGHIFNRDDVGNVNGFARYDE
jgi:hypothetical protein